MANPHHHAASSAKKYGGKPEDYIKIHQWFDASKAHMADFRHRALRHHSQGIFEAETVFGDETGCITNSAGAKIPVRFIGEQHVTEDLGRIPTLADWLMEIKPAGWMTKAKKLSEEQAKGQTAQTAILGALTQTAEPLDSNELTRFAVLTQAAFVEGTSCIPKTHLP